MDGIRMVTHAPSAVMYNFGNVAYVAKKLHLTGTNEGARTRSLP